MASNSANCTGDSRLSIDRMVGLGSWGLSVTAPHYPSLPSALMWTSARLIHSGSRSGSAQAFVSFSVQRTNSCQNHERLSKG
jgi:hypothetical protein